MRIGSPKEVMPGEARVAMTPESAAQLQKLGHECFIESGAGVFAGFSDTDYQEAGVTVVASAKNYSTPLTLSPRCGHLWIPKSKG